MDLKKSLCCSLISFTFFGCSSEKMRNYREGVGLPGWFHNVEEWSNGSYLHRRRKETREVIKGIIFRGEYSTKDRKYLSYRKAEEIAELYDVDLFVYGRKKRIDEEDNLLVDK